MQELAAGHTLSRHRSGAEAELARCSPWRRCRRRGAGQGRAGVTREQAAWQGGPCARQGVKEVAAAEEGEASGLEDAQREGGALSFAPGVATVEESAGLQPGKGHSSSSSSNGVRPREGRGGAAGPRPGRRPAGGEDSLQASAVDAGALPAGGPGGLDPPLEDSALPALSPASPSTSSSSGGRSDSASPASAAQPSAHSLQTAGGGRDVDSVQSGGDRASVTPVQSAVEAPGADGLQKAPSVLSTGTVPSPASVPSTETAESTPSAQTASSAQSTSSAQSGGSMQSGGSTQRASSVFLHPSHVEQRKEVSDAWLRILRWSKAKFRQDGPPHALSDLHKVVVFGGGSFGTAMGVALARQKAGVRVSLLLRDPAVCADINALHRNTRYLPDYELPPGVSATTSAAEAVAGAQYAIHAVPVQHSRALLTGLQALLPPDLPLISVSKGLEAGTGQTMSQLIPSALGRPQPVALLSGPSFAKEVMDSRPTGVVAASQDAQLAQRLQQLFASPYMRVNTSSDVVGVEVCGALKNVLALAAGIVEGLELGQNALAALISQGCAEIRWLAERMGAVPATVAGLSGLGDIMLTCYGALSRNRAVGIRLGQGEALADIVASSKQIAEGVATAGSVVLLARRYRVSLPVLTAVAQVVDGNLTPKEAVYEIMMLPQIEEK